MTDQSPSDPLTREGLCSGPLGPYVDAFAKRLRDLGYARSTRRAKLRVLAGFSRWLQRQELQVADVNERVINRYLERCGRGDATTLGDLLEALREAAVVSRPSREADEAPLERVEREFGQHLAVERGLSQATLKNSLPFVLKSL